MSLPPRRKLRKRIELVGSRAILRAISWTASVLPDRLAGRFGEAIGDAIYALLPRYRRVAISNLKWVYRGVLSPAEIRQLARRAYRHFGKCAVEFLRLPHMSPEDINNKIRLEGTEHLDAALAEGKGVVLVTAHFGNWELLAAKMVQDGYRVNVIARDADDTDTTRVVNAIREGRGYHVYSRGGSMLPVVRALKSNQILALLADQHDYDGIFVDFFGRPAKTPSGPAALALMTGALVVPVFCLREPGDRFTGRFYPALDLVQTGDKERDIHDWTARITQVIEEQVRLAPDQWLWLHNRWKSQPPADVRELDSARR